MSELILVMLILLSDHLSFSIFHLISDEPSTSRISYDKAEVYDNVLILTVR